MLIFNRFFMVSVHLCFSHGYPQKNTFRPFNFEPAGCSYGSKFFEAHLSFR